MDRKAPHAPATSSTSGPLTLAIIGGGPAGATLAALLAQRGWTPLLFADDRTPDLIVGESLIPAILPTLRRLGVEDRVAAISQYKSGVTFLHPEASQEMDFTFDSVRGILPDYAYNVPRPAFDHILAQRATELGVVTIPARAEVEPDQNGGLRLTAPTLAAAPTLQGRQPDWLIDASGRSRLIAKTLGIPVKRGRRNDIAYFAHYSGCHHPKPEGQVIITRLAAGWSWRIPLPGRMSIGVVMNREDARTLGDGPEERLAAAIQRDPSLAAATGDAQRLTAVKTYSNYQLLSEKGVGPGWVQLGDAFGFVDPMLSPGLFLAIASAETLADVFHENRDTPERLQRALAAYESGFVEWVSAWSELVEMFYDGRIFSLHEAGQLILKERANFLTNGLRKHIHKHIACMAAGAWTRRAYSRRLLRFTTKHLIWGVNPPGEMAIR